MLEKILYVLAKIVEFLLIIGSVVIVGMVTTEVVMRKFFGSSLIFTEELARYLMVWIVFLGSVLAVRDSAHIRINILVKRFGHRAQQFFALTAYSLTALFLVVLAVQGIKILPQQLWQFCITMDVSPVSVLPGHARGLHFNVAVHDSQSNPCLFRPAPGDRRCYRWRKAGRGMLSLALVFVLTILCGVPVAICLGLAGLAFVFFTPGQSFTILPTLIFGGIDSFPLMAIPFFIMAGDMMSRSGVLPDLVKLADSIVGHLKGGLAYVNILASMFFAGVTGVAVADTAAVGSMLVPAMIKQGYSRSFSAVVTAASSIVGPIIPPSVAMLIYAHVYGGGISVAKLFLLGAIPGCIVGFGMMGLVFLLSFKQNFPASTVGGFSLAKVMGAAVKAIPGLMVPVIILGGIIGGWFTPTEAGAVAVTYALLIGVFLTRTLKPRDIAACFITSCRTSAVVFLLLATAKVISFILVSHQVPQNVAKFFLQYTDSPQVFLLFTIIFLLLLGFVLEAVATMIMLIPVFGPMAQQFGIEPHHFGLIVVMTVQVALITPPVALGLFICTPIAECSMEDASREIWPFLLLVFACVVLVAFFPGVTTWFPRLFGY